MLWLVWLNGLLISATRVSVPRLLIDSFYRTGSLVFGGGHVVLPLLQAEIVPKGWLDNSTFLAGYGIAQALPGPLFSLAAYLGAAKSGSPNGWLAGLWCLFAILLPPILLVTGLLPLWNRLRASAAAQSLLAGANATVVGILLAALYQPVWTSAIDSGKSLALSLILFVGLQIWKIAPWILVLTGVSFNTRWFGLISFLSIHCIRCAAQSVSLRI